MLGQYQVGVMQGRLLPKYQGRYQAHPKGYWQEEFVLAHEVGLNLIEFILNLTDALENPLMNPQGLAEIRNITQASRVQVRSICADYFMEAPLQSTSPETAANSQNILNSLLKNSASIGVTDVVIPLVDRASLKNDNDKERFIKNILPSAEEAEKLGIHIALETDLPPNSFLDLLNALDSHCFTVNYDTGNSASLGHDPEKEFEAYGNRISKIHVKDRVLGGASVPLGQGNADFKKSIGLITDSDFSGSLIFEAYRDDEGRAIFEEQLEWFKSISGLK
jgi:L-ribulose-5-phosphate 3-epimerase